MKTISQRRQMKTWHSSQLNFCKEFLFKMNKIFKYFSTLNRLLLSVWWSWPLWRCLWEDAARGCSWSWRWRWQTNCGGGTWFLDSDAQASGFSWKNKHIICCYSNKQVYISPAKVQPTWRAHHSSLAFVCLPFVSSHIVQVATHLRSKSDRGELIR